MASLWFHRDRVDWGIKSLDILAITESAREAIGEILNRASQPATIRLDVSTGACSWPSFGLTFDQKKDSDLVWFTGNIEWVIDKALFAKAGTISIDYVRNEREAQFVFTSNYPLVATCFGCSTKCKNDLTEKKKE